MRIDRHQPIESLAQELGKKPGADCLAGMEALILAHVWQIGTDEADASGAEIARGRRQEGQWQDLFVRSIQRANKNDGMARNRRSQPDITLAIGKSPDFAEPEVRMQRRGKCTSCRLIARHREDERRHEGSTRTISGQAVT